ncbi:hypothetical protein TsFJ059_008995 [Trichoderma semiorbis]|uniref:Uncharacterized protein n=1 Tax=Trichoderma semiorbis TaxID=1491008 RepID=A0A9P8HDH4_9HYPO|nr:hypothetical protein TsFJ059_008995 [Trichoderma semiorbis]KAH0524081.1 hypothetical protein TsFJ059_008995 [Trichoderma semiorbis]
MGLLDFLSKRPSVDATSPQKSQAPSPHARGIIASRENGTRTPDPSQRLLKPRLVGVTEGRPRTNPKDSEVPQPQFPLKATGRSPKESIAPLALSSIPKYDDRERPQSRGTIERLTPLTPNFSLPRRRSSAFVDILDAQGEFKPYDFRSRLQASGSREYGEDVADRNIQPAVTGTTLPYRPRGSASTASSSRNAYAVPPIPDRYRDLPSPRIEPSIRSSSRQTVNSRPMSRGKLSPARAEFDVHDHRLQSKSSYGQISISGSRASTPQQAPRTADGRYMRDEGSAFSPELRSASPPGVPRYKPRQYSMPSGKVLSGTLPGSVRSAREHLNSLVPPHSDRSKQLYQQRAKTPTSPNQLHSFRHRVENDWSRFNRHAGDYPPPTTSTWDDAIESNSEYAPSFTFGSSGNLQLENTERPPPSIRTFGKRGIRTADTSIDIPHNSLFNDMTLFGGSSHKLRSRAGDSPVAPDFTGKEDDSGAESIFISPATPSEEQPSFNPLSPTHRHGGLSVSSYDATSISDSDVDSFRGKQRQPGRDGEALPFSDQGFGDDGKSLPGLFNETESLATPKWPDMPMTPTDVSEMGDDEASVVGVPPTVQKSRQNTSRPFTQRERLLALGYDYDSDSDTESSLRSDEIPEERALKLLSTLIKNTTAKGPAGISSPQLDMKTIAKLRKEIKKRRLLDSSSSRRGRSSQENSEVDAVTTK